MNAPEVEPVQYELDGHIARIWLNRPHKRNAVTTQVLDLLEEFVLRAEADDNVRAIVIRGRDGTFSSGFDLDELSGDYIGSSTAFEIARRSAAVCDRLFKSNLPSVAVVEGYATAGGFEIMINCDFAIASSDALLGDFHIRRALFGGAGPIYRLPRMLGIRRAKELMLTGALLTGAEAADWGLVNRCATPPTLDKCVDEFVATLTDKSPFQMSITKMAVSRSLDSDTETLIVLEALATGVTLNSEDAREGVNAFLEKREPKWTGR